jgi:AcrR family transcriptional regulator
MADDGTDHDQEPAPEPPTMAIPASIRAAWGVTARPARGPRPGLSLDRIVQAAIGVAGSEGLDAVSMGRVASELGSSPMALYRYVGSKDELLALMVDTAMGAMPEPVDGDGWRANLTRWSMAALGAYLASPWVVRVPIPAPPITPNQIRALEMGLRCLRGTGLTHQEKLSTILLVSGLVRYYGTLTADFTDAYEAAGGVDPSAGYGRAVVQLVDPQRFPEVMAAIGSGTLDDEDPQFALTEVTFGLDRIMDGLETLIAERHRP